MAQVDLTAISTKHHFVKGTTFLKHSEMYNISDDKKTVQPSLYFVLPTTALYNIAIQTFCINKSQMWTHITSGLCARHVIPVIICFCFHKKSKTAAYQSFSMTCKYHIETKHFIPQTSFWFVWLTTIRQIHTC